GRCSERPPHAGSARAATAASRARAPGPPPGRATPPIAAPGQAVPPRLRNHGATGIADLSGGCQSAPVAARGTPLRITEIDGPESYHHLCNLVMYNAEDPDRVNREIDRWLRIDKTS